MWQNYLKVAWRDMVRHKGFSFIHILGLAVGLAFFTIVVVTVGIDLRADRFHKNAPRICGVIQVNVAGDKEESHAIYAAGSLLPALRGEFPEIENGVRVRPAPRMIVRQEEKVFYQNDILFVDPGFLSIFSFPMTRGNPATALAQPATAVISESTARKYFAAANPLGRILLLDGRVPVTVTGVVKDLLEYSSLQFEMLLSRDTARQFKPEPEDWNSARDATFLLLRRGIDRERLQGQLSRFLHAHYGDAPQAPKRLYLMPLLDLRLKSIVPVPIQTFLIRSHPLTAIVNISLAVIILLIVCINFMNLATARYAKRAKEIGLRKAIGAGRAALIRQFIAESLVQAAVALPLALILYGIGLPALVRMYGLSKEFPIWNHPHLFAILAVVTMLAGVFAGSYPAFFLSAFRPSLVLKGDLSRGRKGTTFRRLLVVVQFALAVFLFTITLMARNQHRHTMNADFGYDRQRILAMSIAGVSGSTVELLKTELARSPAVKSLTATAGLPGSWNPEQIVVPEDMDEGLGRPVNTYGVDEDFIETLGIGLLRGREFSHRFDDRDSVIINETMARELKWDNPIGRRLVVAGRAKTVVGVAQDFMFRRTTLNLGPALLFMEPSERNWLLLKYGPEQRAEDMQALAGRIWTRLAPDLPFERTTLDDHFHLVYRSQENAYQILQVMDGIMIFIASLGLLGLASFMVERRTKEIGIRKVLGASILGIIRLLSREYIVLVALANAAAIPFSVWIMQRLLQITYAYSIAPLNTSIFIFTIALTLTVAFLAVASQVQRAIRLKPVDSLRHE